MRIEHVLLGGSPDRLRTAIRRPARGQRSTGSPIRVWRKAVPVFTRGTLLPWGPGGIRVARRIVTVPQLPLRVSHR